MSQHLGRTGLAYSRAWHLVNVGQERRSLGRLATAIAVTLMGKHKPIYHPSTDCGDYVVAVGCHDLHVTGKKRDQKMYYKHTTRPGGGFKEMNMERLFTKFGGGEVLKRAVSGMLPKNRLREPRLARLKVFEGHGHPYKQNIVQLEPTSNRRGPNQVETRQSKIERAFGLEPEPPVIDRLSRPNQIKNAKKPKSKAPRVRPGTTRAARPASARKAQTTGKIVRDARVKKVLEVKENTTITEAA